MVLWLRTPLLAAGIALLATSVVAQGDDEFTERTLPSDWKLRKTEQVFLDDVHAGRDGKRLVDVYLRALTRHGDPVLNLKNVDLHVSEDGRDVDQDDLRVESLESSGRGVTCVLLIDNSRTMSGEPFDRARDAALNFARRLGSRDKLAIVSFAGAPELVSGFDDPRAKAEVLLQALEIEPNSLNTTMNDAVYKAVDLVRQRSDLPRRSLVVLFSDGNDGGSNHSLEQAIELAAGNATEPRLLVYTIGYARFGGEGIEVLRRLSRDTGASSFEATSTGQLNTFYKQILENMMQSYVVSFPSALDGEDHVIKVVVEGQTHQRGALYPDIPRPRWPWILALALLLGGVATYLLIRRVRSPGTLVFIDGPMSGQQFPLRQGRLRIGATEDNDLVIEIPTVSRYHAELTVKGRDIEIEDLRSSNGTLVNGAQIQRSPLHPGDRITIADVELRYER